MNPYYYLFYKLNRALNRKGNNEWGPISGVTMLLAANISLAYFKVMQELGTVSASWHKVPLLILGVVMITTNMVLLSNKQRVRGIMERYRGESSTRARLGSMAVLLYALASVALIFVV